MTATIRWSLALCTIFSNKLPFHHFICLKVEKQKPNFIPKISKLILKSFAQKCIGLNKIAIEPVAMCHVCQKHRTPKLRLEIWGAIIRWTKLTIDFLLFAPRCTLCYVKSSSHSLKLNLEEENQLRTFVCTAQ